MKIEALVQFPSLEIGTSWEVGSLNSPPSASVHFLHSRGLLSLISALLWSGRVSARSSRRPVLSGNQEVSKGFPDKVSKAVGTVGTNRRVGNTGRLGPMR